MEEHEEQGDFGSFGGEPIGVAFAVTLDEAVGFHFAEIVAQLVQAVALVGQTVGGEEGLMNLFGAPASQLSAAMQQDFHQADHARVVDLDAWQSGPFRP